MAAPIKKLQPSDQGVYHPQPNAQPKTVGALVSQQQQQDKKR
jgi:hypothetical protein